ncbi:MAG: peptidoglycan-binding protein [Selenomonadaceae bacterium]|nr:peptidoglycan-binding protein [Selenomonadaceae bacterium]
MQSTVVKKIFGKSLRKKICAWTLIFSSVTCGFEICAAAGYGDSGAEVSEIQTCLTAQGLYYGAIDGYYGDATANAIRDFQSAIGLPANGICDDKTFALLHAAAYDEIDITTLMRGDASNYLKPGDSGERVKELQRRLIELGYMVGTADGIYSSATSMGVRSFQADYFLKIDGLCGSETLNKLNSVNSSDIAAKDSNFAEIGSIIRKDMRGPGVVDVQKKLIALGYFSGKADGYCDDATVDAIKNFQAANGIEPTGVCEIMTYAALENVQYGERDAEWEKSVEEFPKFERTLYVEATAYSSQDPGLGKFTARGNPVGRGIISVDPNVIPLGTRVYIPGYGEAIADDIGGAIKGNVIDIAFDTYEEAMAFGRQTIEIYIISE